MTNENHEYDPEYQWVVNDENLSKYEDKTINVKDFGGDSKNGGWVLLETGEKLLTSFPVVQNMGKFAHEQIEKKGFFGMEVVKKTSRRLGTTHYWIE